ncbi:hypothetical protein [Mycolicibacterium wolinskyi]|uniref:hypothetical protein n=1 Tax=Mycolicibacterium wolinskyi TaxID=59750 RepID=UPI003917AE83
MTPEDRLDAAESTVDELDPTHPNYAALHALVAIGRFVQHIHQHITQETSNGTV